MLSLSISFSARSGSFEDLTKVVIVIDLSQICTELKSSLLHL